MCYVSSRSGVATLRTAIHLLLTYLLCFLAATLQTRLNGLTSYECRVQQITAAVGEEISRRDSTRDLEERLQSLNRLWADIARKLGTSCLLSVASAAYEDGNVWW